MTNAEIMSVIKRRSDTENLDKATQIKYMQAASYYTVKKQAFLRQVQSSMQNDNISLEKLEKNITETYNKISEIWNKMDSLILDIIAHDKTINQLNTRGEKVTSAISKIIDPKQKKNLELKLKTYNVSDDDLNMIVDIYKNINLNSMLMKVDNSEYINSEFASILGQAFEPFAASAINYFAKQCGNFGRKCVDSLIGDFTQTGDKTVSVSTAMKESDKQMSSDIAVGVTDENKNFIDMSFEENLEVQKIQHKNLINTKQFDNSVGQRLYELLNAPGSAREEVFGFSLKRWKDGDQNKEYTSSSVMQTKMNQIFFNTKETWNYKYAFARTQLELSKNAIALFGPTNIGVFTTQGFTWMDDFITNRRLFMNVYSLIKPKYEEILPYVNSGSIYIHNLNKDKITWKKAGIDSDFNEPYYKITFTSKVK